MRQGILRLIQLSYRCPVKHHCYHIHSCIILTLTVEIILPLLQRITNSNVFKPGTEIFSVNFISRHVPNLAVEWLALLRRIWKETGSKPRRRIALLIEEFVVLPVPLDKILVYNIKMRSRLIPSTFLLIQYLIIVLSLDAIQSELSTATLNIT